MKLDSLQKDLLAGGGGVARAMKTLVAYGESFGAPRLVPIASAHLAGTFRIVSFKAYYRIVDRLVKEGARVKVFTTGNPRPGVDAMFANRLIFHNQAKLEEQFDALGVTPNYSCVCYDDVNVPKLGDNLAWAESSAVQFANSVLGARTNRNSVLIDLCSAITGYTPEFGFLLDENRVGRVRVKLEVKEMDPSALGYLVGQKVVGGVPVIDHYDFDAVDLKNLGGAMAASGATAMFHVEGVTPEAPDVRTAFDGEPKETVAITQDDLDSLRTNESEKAGMVVFGCPQMTLPEATRIGEGFVGKRVKKRTWFCMVPAAKEEFERSGLGRKVVEAGVELVSCCPLAALSAPFGRKTVLTSSGKLFYYLADTLYGNQRDCLRACGADA